MSVHRAHCSCPCGGPPRARGDLYIEYWITSEFAPTRLRTVQIYSRNWFLHLVGVSDKIKWPHCNRKLERLSGLVAPKASPCFFYPPANSSERDKALPNDGPRCSIVFSRLQGFRSPDSYRDVGRTNSAKSSNCQCNKMCTWPFKAGKYSWWINATTSPRLVFSLMIRTERRFIELILSHQCSAFAPIRPNQNTWGESANLNDTLRQDSRRGDSTSLQASSWSRDSSVSDHYMKVVPAITWDPTRRLKSAF